jgi:DNA (cytosine-5)-methyltransferase 1
MKLLDAFCCQGGAGEGYARAGFDVVGVDNVEQPRNPRDVVVADAVVFIMRRGHEFDAIHASPPCQGYSDTYRIMGGEWPRLIAATRDACRHAGVPYVIENVMGARDEMENPHMLCGTMFPGLRVYRHRLFETSFPYAPPEHGEHVAPQVKMGRAPKPGEWVQAVGNFSAVQEARDAMDCQWMNREGLRECIPPAYTEHIGAQLMAHLTRERVAA